MKIATLPTADAPSTLKTDWEVELAIWHTRTRAALRRIVDRTLQGRGSSKDDYVEATNARGRAVLILKILPSLSDVLPEFFGAFQNPIKHPDCEILQRDELFCKLRLHAN